jgi:large subunit ribosomal protein L10e
MGDTKGQFEVEGQLIALREHKSATAHLEAARVATNRILMDKLINDYYMNVHPYPHIILRENKMIFGAHADRLQQGMRRSFGSAVGTAAKVEVDQPIITVRVKAGQERLPKNLSNEAAQNSQYPAKLLSYQIEAPPSQPEKAQPETETS